MECKICCKNIENLDKILKLECSCKHIFHKYCIEKWLNTSINCSLCGKNIKRDNIKETEYNKSLEKQEWKQYIYDSTKTYNPDEITNTIYRLNYNTLSHMMLDTSLKGIKFTL
jgi:hypothetical protein